MGKVSKAEIKRLVKNNSGVAISDTAIESIAKLLEAKAKKIAEYAVKRAKAHNRDVVTEEDVDTYRLKFGD
jgi:histone H3/H4